MSHRAYFTQGLWLRRVALLMIIGPLLAAWAQDPGAGLILQIIRDGDTQRLQWASVTGRDYVVQARTNLTTDPWREVLTTNASGPFTAWTDPAQAGDGRFYRVVYQGPELPAAVTLGSFSLADPSFVVTGTMANDFQNSIRTSLASRMRAYASDPTHVAFADRMLDQNVALGGAWRTFSGNSNPDVYFSSVPGFLADAGHSIPAWVPEVQEAINDINAAIPGTPSDLLGKALRGISVTVCVLRNPITGNCISEQTFHYGGGCNEYPISCTAGGLINNDIIPLLIGRIDQILDSVPLVSIQSASFTADLAELRKGDGTRMAVALSFMNQPENLVVNGWSFGDMSQSVNALRDALVLAF